MPLGAAVAIVAVISLLNLLLIFGVIRRLRDHTERWSQLSHGPGEPILRAGSRIGKFTAIATDGDSISSDVLVGRTLVGFFSPGCGPCDSLLPRFVEYALSMPGGRRQVLAVIAGDVEGAAEKIDALRPYARVVVEAHDGAVMTAFGVHAYPVVCIVEDGTVAISAGDLKDFPAHAAI